MTMDIAISARLAPRQGANGLAAHPAARQGERIHTKNSLAVLFLLASCCYELPLVSLFGLHRADPRLFDVACLFALLVTASDGRRMSRGDTEANWIVRPLVLLLGAAAFATLATLLLLVPYHLIRYPVFYFCRYAQLVFAVWFVATARLSKRQVVSVLYLFLIAAHVPLVAGILQYAGVISPDRVLAGGDTIALSEGRLTSVLGHHYGHYSMFSLLVVVVCLVLRLSGVRKGVRHHILTLSAIGLAMVGIFISGSRSGPYGLVLLAMVLAVRSPSARLWPKYIAVLGLIAITSYFVVGGVFAPEATVRFKDSVRELLPGSRDRPEHLEDTVVAQRSMVGLWGIVYHLDYHGPAMLIWGTGFYVSSVEGRIRKGYGIHSVPFFPLEQMGLPGFLAGLYLFASLLKRSHRFSRGTRSMFTRCAGDGMFAWWIVILVVGLGGQVFWIFQGFGNFTALQLCLCALLLGRRY